MFICNGYTIFCGYKNRFKYINKYILYCIQSLVWQKIMLFKLLKKSTEQAFGDS